jgi:hypothetical protein
LCKPPPWAESFWIFSSLYYQRAFGGS